MSKHERSRFVEQLLKEELDAVALGLEQGVYAWEEIDLPHDSQGSTPLISACRTGLMRLIHFLLKRGADATVCNNSNQTALHVSQPALQGELLMAMIRDVPHQKQLSLAAWRGDLRCLQDLMAQADLLELNKQNRDGLTPLMLAVRDVDLFEGLETPWEYQPVEVVKELMSFPVDIKILDGRGHTALWYASQIKSTKKEELFHIMDSSMQTETIFTCLDASYWPVSPPVLPCCSPTHGCYTPESDGMKKDSAEIIMARKDHADIHQGQSRQLDLFSANPRRQNAVSEVHLQDLSRMIATLSVHSAFKSFGSLFPCPQNTHTEQTQTLSPSLREYMTIGGGVSDSAFWAPLFQMSQTTQSRPQTLTVKDYARLTGTVNIWFH